VAANVSVQNAVREADGVFDLAIANAGDGVPSHETKLNIPDAEQMVLVNILGMMYLFGAVMLSMIERRSGHFTGIASLAGMRGLPTSSVYSATKAAMQACLEASRIELAPYHVAVTIVTPGFIA